MEAYKYTQTGYFSIITIVPVLIFISVITFLSGFENSAFTIIMGIVTATLTVCLLIFYKLTITISSTYVTLSFGTGLFKKKYALSDIKSCSPVKNPLWYGIGIRLIPDGWLYNVSGFYAIELTFRNKKSKVRIGTDKPEEISGIINNLLNKSYTEHTFEYAGKRGYYVFLAFILVVLVFPALMIFYGSKDIKIDYSETGFRIKGMYGMDIKYLDIRDIDTLDILPSIKSRTNGFAAAKTLKGNFKLYDNTKAKLFVKKDSSPYINIKTDNNNIYLNFRDPETTASEYKKISAALSKNQ